MAMGIFCQSKVNASCAGKGGLRHEFFCRAEDALATKALEHVRNYLMHRLLVVSLQDAGVLGAKYFLREI